MKLDSKKRLQTALNMDMLIGMLMMLPLLSNIIPGNPFNLGLEEHSESLKIIIGLILWTVAIVWVARLRKIKDIRVVVPVLVLIGGQVTTCFFLLTYFGAGMLAVALSPVIPYIYSRSHVHSLKKLINES